MTHTLLCLFFLFQAKPVSPQTADERAIHANYAQWQQAYKQKRPRLIERLLTPRFRLKDVDGEINRRADFMTLWVKRDIKESDAITGKIVIYKIQPYGNQLRAVVDDGYWKHRDYWQKTHGVWKLSKRNMYGPSAAQENKHK